MGTTDHAELVSQFVQVMPGSKPDLAEFFLEANNWNLAVSVDEYISNIEPHLLWTARPFL